MINGGHNEALEISIDCCRACPTFAEALQAIPEACRIENCRRQAREAKLAGLKRYRFIRDCHKKIRFVCYGNL